MDVVIAINVVVVFWTWNFWFESSKWD